MASNDCEPELLWKLARSHGWSEFVDVAELASDAAVADEREARRVAREQLSERDYIVYRQDTDRIKFGRPPLDQAAIDLSEYGYSDLKIAATFGDQQDTIG